MLLGTDELTILRGSKFYGTWQWINSVTGDAEDFAGLTASVKIKNIHEDFANVKNTYEVGTVIVEPEDRDGNAFKGRVDIELSKEETLIFAIPESEDDRYGESDFYAILEILLSTGEVILQAKVRVVESLESETVNFLTDNRGEAIIINGKLDNILLKNDEYISTRDNLIDVVIPTALLIYNTNHNEKMDIYNANHTNKLDVYNSNDTSKINIYNQNHATKLQEINTLALDVQSNKDLVDQAKANVLAMKDDVQGNKESVALMKTAIEIMLDNFDDRFLGLKDSDPLLDNDGNPLQIAAIYYNNLLKELRFYNGTSWDSPVAAAQTYALQASQSASDALASKNAAKLSEDNAKISEQNAQNLVNQVANNYEPKNQNIQSHILNNTNPHETTASQVGAYSIIESDIKYSQKVNILDIQDLLTSTDSSKPLSANQGKVLKELIDNINTIITSDDTTLDQMQEVVNFIKQNKTDLQNLDLSNIAETVTLKHFTAILKTKLDGIAENANNYSHPAGDGNLHVPANGTANDGKFLQATSVAGVYSWASLPATSLSSLGINATATELNYMDGVSSNVQEQFAGKASIISPSFMDSPSAPTPSLGDNSTRLATTAFVLANADKVTSAKIGLAIAGISAGDIGSYSFLAQKTATTNLITVNNNYAGSGFYYSGIYNVGTDDTAYVAGSTASPIGTWKAMSNPTTSPSSLKRTALFLRIA